MHTDDGQGWLLKSYRNKKNHKQPKCFKIGFYLWSSHIKKLHLLKKSTWFFKLIFNEIGESLWHSNGKSSICIYWVGQRVHPHFSVTLHRKTKQIFWPTQHNINYTWVQTCVCMYIRISCNMYLIYIFHTHIPVICILHIHILLIPRHSNFHIISKTVLIWKFLMIFYILQ